MLNKNKDAKRLVEAILFAADEPLDIETIKSKIELGKWLGLHPIYQNEIPGVFRKPHASLWKLFKGWESNGAHFHETIVPFWEATMRLDTGQKQIDKVIAEIPKNVVKSIGKQELIWAFRLYQKAIVAQKPYYEKQQLMPSYLLKDERRAMKRRAARNRARLAENQNTF